MKERTRKIFIMIVMAALIVSLTAASFAALTYGRYTGGKLDEDSPYEEIIDFVGDRPLVAHNAPFDMRVLRASAACYGIQLPDWDYYCSLAIARKVLPHFRSRSLGVLVSDYLCSDYDAHVASDDARACGLVFGRMLHDRLYDKATLDHYLSLLGVNYPKKLNQAGQA